MSVTKRYSHGAAAIILVAADAVCAMAGAPAWCWGVLLALALLYAAGASAAAGRERAAELCAVGAIVGLGTWLLLPAFCGDRPLDGDHTAHFMRVWYLEHVMLPRGELFGWGNEWFAGHPVGYLYPFFGHLLVVLLHKLSLGGLDLNAAYALAIWLVFIFGGFAVYRLGAFAVCRWVGLAAALLYITDFGSAAEHVGGWQTFVKLGIWPNALSVALSTLALIPLIRIFTGGAWRDVRALALLWGFALLAHPLQLVNIPLVSGAAVLAALAAVDSVQLRRAVPRLLAAALLAGALSAVWVLPFLSAARFTYPLNNVLRGVGMTLADMTAGLNKGQVLLGMWPLAAVLGVAGVAALLRARRFAQLLIGVLALLCCILPVLEVQGALLRLLPRALVSRIEYTRFFTLARPLWFIAAGYALYAIAAAGNPAAAAAPGSRQRRVWHTCLIVSLALPLIWLIGAAWLQEREKAGPMTYLSQREQTPRAALAAFLNAKAGGDFFRVAVFESHHEHRLIDLGTELRAPLMKIGWTPVSMYRYQHFSPLPDQALLRMLNVRYVVSDGTRAVYLKALNRTGEPPTYRFLERFGDLFLFEFVPWSPAAAEVIEGQGAISAWRIADETIEVLAEPGAEGRMRLAVSYFDRWRASRDGQALEIRPEPTKLDGKDNRRTSFITLPLAPGRYRIYFQRSWIELLSPWLTLLTLLGLLGGPLLLRRFGGRPSR